MHEMIKDQAGFDRLAEADFVGEQPADGICGRRAFGHIQLVREQANASAEERTGSALANRPQPADVVDDPGIRLADRRRGKPSPEFPLIDLRQCIAGCSDAQRLAGAREVDNQRAAFNGGDTSYAQLRIEAVGEVIPFRPCTRGICHLAPIVSACLDAASHFRDASSMARRIRFVITVI